MESRIQEMDNFLKSYALIVKENPRYEFDPTFWYAQLSDYGYTREESEIMRKYHAQMGSYFSSTRGRNIVPQPSGFPAPGSTPSVRISRRVIPPPDFGDDLPF